MPTSVRLDARTERLISTLARKTGRTKSGVIREAIVRMADTEGEARPAASPYEAFKHLIGIAKGGPTDLSERTGEKVRKLLEARRRP